MNEAEAEALWSELRQAFVNAESAIVKIIREKAWEPIGYPTFIEAWNARMSGVRLATDALKVAVVYQMLNEGATPDEITAIPGVGPETERVLRSKHGEGVPPEVASPRRRFGDPEATVPVDYPAFRRSPGPRQSVHVSLSAHDYKAFQKLAKRNRTTVALLAEAAIVSFLDRQGN